MQGDKRAYIKLGWMHWEPERFLKRMLSQARRWAARAVRRLPLPQTGPLPHTNGGWVRARQGRTVADLHLEGARWFQMAAEDVGRPARKCASFAAPLADARGAQGDADAANQLGLMYVEGNGVEVDFKLAEEWLMRAVRRKPRTRARGSDADAPRLAARPSARPPVRRARRRTGSASAWRRS